jgi:hypothetical protein
MFAAPASVHSGTPANQQRFRISGNTATSRSPALAVSKTISPLGSKALRYAAIHSGRWKGALLVSSHNFSQRLA